ncbi:cytochrome P450 [Aspergillus homomorphus CBS 101889]|uniref:Cytochrome protein n=1 Tax=Aspergillus homomorphus (strain CBS 101889) TaxID=1450537 RepID=A0A395I9D5_ASPHC|nr:cytochrome protein [Aspergillus homomorphus CBS 101889]RAL16880.1 cytochrome protein [Aspergillus homomorphus CBS 101889]
MAALAVFGCSIALYLVLRSIYRVYFHPLSKIPGPKLAAITHGYEFYFNVIKGGLFIWEIERLHQVYGPIIRIGPGQVHIRDPDYYEEVYASRARKREKDPVTVARFALDGSVFSSITDEDHRSRRAPLDKFFSKQAISNVEYLIRESLDKLVRHLRTAHESHKVVHLDAGFAALTADVIHVYAFGFNPGNLDQDGFNANVRDGINALFQMGHIAYFFPFIQNLINALPLPVLRKLSAPAYALARQKKDIYECGAAALKSSLATQKSGNPTIFEAIAGPKMPEHLRTPERLMNEGFTLTVGGTETTARSLAIAMYHLIDRPEVLNKLREELKQVVPTPDSRPTWNELEKLPYMSGVVNETLRLSTGIASYSPRVAPTEALQYKGYTIPPGTPVGQTHYFILMDPNIFPDPHAFEPERWIRAAATGNRLDRYLVNFSKGSRICVGLNLAYAELYLVIATLVRRFEMELYDTPRSTIELKRDYGTPYPEEGHLKVQVLVTGLVTE